MNVLILVGLCLVSVSLACHNGHQCDCPNGQNGVCNSQGHCECGDHSVGKRATCHNNHDCNSGCPTGQNGVCNSQGHCECGDHTVGKRATCHNNHDCNSGCPTGQNGVCNTQNQCECGDHVVGRAIHEGSHCTQTSDCAGLTCAGNNGHDYSCTNNKCTCTDHSGK